MTDRELLELAAKAAGIEVEWREWTTGRIAEFQTIKYTKHEGFWGNGVCWNPLTDDGQALRLAVKLRIDLVVAEDHIAAANYDFDKEKFLFASKCEGYRPCPYAATRRAIVRAAAEIAKQISKE